MKIKVVLINYPDGQIFWPSLKTAVRSITNLWTLYKGSRSDLSLVILDSNPEDISKNKSILEGADYLVFPWDGANYLAKIRGECGIYRPSLIYVHGEGTIGFSRGISHIPFLDAGDVYLPSSQAEKKAIELSFIDPQVVVTPYPLSLDYSPPRKSIVKSGSEIIRLVYVGRITEQKNLHPILTALCLVSRKNPLLRYRLDIYGTDDRYGSPNMNLPSEGYINFLKALVTDFNIDEKVYWHGYTDPKILRPIIQAVPHFFITTSLHSDEAFGMSAYNSLINGNIAILSDWGGHRDLKEGFKNLVKLVKVHSSDQGPYISPVELADTILKVVPDKRLRKAKLPKKYKVQSMCKNLSLAMDLAQVTKKAQPVSKWANKLHSQVKAINLTGSLFFQQIYTSYSDELAQEVFKCYGMRNYSKILLKANVFVAPWVSFDEGNRSVKVRDPHRGESVFFEPVQTRSCRLDLFAGQSIDVTRPCFDWLDRQGLIYRQSTDLK